MTARQSESPALHLHLARRDKLLNASQDQALLTDMENQVLATYATVAPTVVRNRGWLPS